LFAAIPLVGIRSVEMETRAYTVVGMSCSHCVSSVREEVAELYGVGAVDVELGSGNLVITGDGFSDGAVKAAVEAAGYQLAS
jgi:copper chaperone